MQSNEEYVKDQFRIFVHRGQFRDVLMHTSFIETVIKDTAGMVTRPRKFKKALELLGLIINGEDEKESSYEETSQHKGDCLIEINKLRFQRNELLHDIMKERLPQDYIDKVRDEMKQNIWFIYFKSPLIRDYFKDNRGYDPKDLLTEWSNFYGKHQIIES
jgi:hypothetical protein